MPRKSGNGRARNNNNSQRRDNPERKQYFGHDDRTLHSDRGSRPRVSFKMSRIAKGGRSERSERDRQRDTETALRLHLEDDVNMSDEFRQNRFRRGGRGGPRVMRSYEDLLQNYHSNRGRRNSPVPPRGGGGNRQGQKKLGASPGNWYKVMLSHAAKYEKEYVLEILLSHIAPETFVPLMYKLDGNDATFFVDETKIANKLLSCDRQITTTDGFKLGIRVRPGFPQVQVDQQLKDRIKVAMAKRYVAATNALDLSEFHRDPNLREDLFCALFRPTVLAAVMDIVGEHTPNLEALNLDGNKLQDIEKLGVQLRNKLPNLTILYLGNNRIREWKEIDALKQLKLIELRLVGNPLHEKYKQRPEDFVSDVRKRFPKLLKLDGTDLPPPILFDVATDDGAKLPPTQRAFAVNNDARQVAATFLHQYFLIFDSENRQPLLDAYDEQAAFSLTISCTHDNLNRFNKYLPHNRNLFRVNDRERRHKLLKQGRLPVVSFLSEIPKTKHYLNSFSMDLSLVTEVMMVVTITGIFQEVDTDKKPLRYFSRTLIIVPQGAGYCIRNEQLHIAEPTELQKKQVMEEETSTVNNSARIGGSNEPAVQQDAHLQMALALSQQSGMNLEWSRKCLNEVQWNFESALSAFRSFHQLGQVPPEAFQN